MAGGGGNYLRGVQVADRAGRGRPHAAHSQRGAGLADTSNGAAGIYRQAGARAIMSLRRRGRRRSSGYTGG